jgi:hypothetical protein
MMQIADVLMGAVGFHCNGHHLVAQASPAKIELAEMIAALAGVRTLAVQTQRGAGQFEIWRFRFSGKKKRPTP